MREHRDERTLRHDLDTRRGPRNRGDNDGQRQHVEQKQPEYHGPQSRGDGYLRVLCLTGGDGNHLDTVEGEDADNDRHPHPAEAVRQEAAGQLRQVVKAGGGPAQAEFPGLRPQ